MLLSQARSHCEYCNPFFQSFAGIHAGRGDLRGLCTYYRTFGQKFGSQGTAVSLSFQTHRIRLSTATGAVCKAGDSSIHHDRPAQERPPLAIICPSGPLSPGDGDDGAMNGFRRRSRSAALSRPADIVAEEFDSSRPEARRPVVTYQVLGADDGLVPQNSWNRVERFQPSLSAFFRYAHDLFSRCYGTR